MGVNLAPQKFLRDHQSSGWRCLSPPPPPHPTLTPFNGLRSPGGAACAPPPTPPPLHAAPPRSLPACHRTAGVGGCVSVARARVGSQVYCCVQGCMTAQTHYELHKREDDRDKAVVASDFPVAMPVKQEVMH